MNNEQFERRMEFISEQQAKFTIDIQKLQETQAELTKKHNHLTEALTTVVGMVGRLEKSQERTDEKLGELADAQRETGERLNVFINVVERSIEGRRNGRGQSKTKRASNKGKTKPPRRK